LGDLPRLQYLSARVDHEPEPADEGRPQRDQAEAGRTEPPREHERGHETEESSCSLADRERREAPNQTGPAVVARAMERERHLQGAELYSRHRPYPCFTGLSSSRAHAPPRSQRSSALGVASPSTACATPRARAPRGRAAAARPAAPAPWPRPALPPNGRRDPRPRPRPPRAAAPRRFR